MKQLIDGLPRINQCRLAGKLKAWCYIVLQDNVANKAMRDPGIYSKQVRLEGKHIYPEMAGSAMMPL